MASGLVVSIAMATMPNCLRRDLCECSRNGNQPVRVYRAPSHAADDEPAPITFRSLRDQAKLHDLFLRQDSPSFVANFELKSLRNCEGCSFFFNGRSTIAIFAVSEMNLEVYKK
jgi:hypothetical protein